MVSGWLFSDGHKLVGIILSFTHHFRLCPLCANGRFRFKATAVQCLEGARLMTPIILSP